MKTPSNALGVRWVNIGADIRLKREIKAKRADFIIECIKRGVKKRDVLTYAEQKRNLNKI